MPRTSPEKRPGPSSAWPACQRGPKRAKRIQADESGSTDTSVENIFSASPERAVQLKSLYMRFLLLYIIVGPGPLWDLRAQSFINLHGTLTPSALSLQAAIPGSFSPLLPTCFPSSTLLTRPVYPQILWTG